MSKESELEVQSPPYPPMSVNAVQLYGYLGELSKFLEYYRLGSNKMVGTGPDCIKQPRPLASLDLHTSLSLHRLACLAQSMRVIREAWDLAVRNFENCWETPRAHEARHIVLHRVADMLDSVHLPDEQLEARNSTAQAEAAKQAIFGPFAKFFNLGDHNPFGQTTEDDDDEDDDDEEEDEDDDEDDEE